MCVGCCARCIGIALISLALTAIVTNLMLLFPNGKTKHILEKHIAWEARILPGGWGGGIPVRTFFLAPFTRSTGTKVSCSFYFTPTHRDSNYLSISFLFVCSTENYLYHHSLWRVCEHPRDIVLWNVVLFSILMGTSAIETILCSLQMMNGLLGCIKFLNSREGREGEGEGGKKCSMRWI
uniref:Uncharacterized protein n=1 Tax=Callorhinchus milii TaxID=7868 RepID=A0A4W3IQE4_CALMI